MRLFDTFEGMTPPTPDDVHAQSGQPAEVKFQAHAMPEGGNAWCRATLPEVRANFAAFGIDPQRVHFVQGDVAQTLQQPANLPEKIAVLRLDTDWYESTRAELEVLYPRLARGGVLIVDDYGHWSGARKAVDEYFARLAPRPFLQFTDYTGRCAVKP